MGGTESFAKEGMPFHIDSIQKDNTEIVKTFSGLEQTPRGLGIIRENKYFLFL